RSARSGVEARPLAYWALTGDCLSRSVSWPDLWSDVAVRLETRAPARLLAVGTGHSSRALSARAGSPHRAELRPALRRTDRRDHSEARRAAGRRGGRVC